MAEQAIVLSAEGMIVAAQTITSTLKDTKQEIKARLESAERILNDTKKEQSISEGMLTAAKAVEAAAAAALAAASAKAAKAAAAEAAAIASGNPVAIAAASAVAVEAAAREAKALKEHRKAVEHRKRLEERVRLARKCVEIATSNNKILQSALFGLEKVLCTIGTQGISRLRLAYDDTRNYNSELSPFPNLDLNFLLSGTSHTNLDSQYADAPTMNSDNSNNESKILEDYASTEKTAKNDVHTDAEASRNVADANSAEDNDCHQNSSEPERKMHYDDNGNLYRIGNDLQPNTTYTVNGYTYQTDEQGRIISASGTLRVKDRKERMPIRDTIEDIGKGDEKSDDDRGHLIGDQFDGSNGLENMIPQNARINRVVYKNFENQLAKLVKEGKKVTVLVEPSYTGDSHRPDGIWVTYTVDDGTEEMVFFPNDEEATP